MIIDCHGHYTTAPAQLQAYRERQIAALADPTRRAVKEQISKHHRRSDPARASKARS